MTQELFGGGIKVKDITTVVMQNLRPACNFK